MDTLELATPHSLVILDEIGRGTSISEGLGISFAVAETLLLRKVGLLDQSQRYRRISITLLELRFFYYVGAIFPLSKETLIIILVISRSFQNFLVGNHL